MVVKLSHKIDVFKQGIILDCPEDFFQSLKSCFQNEKARLITGGTLEEAKEAMFWKLHENPENGNSFDFNPKTGETYEVQSFGLQFSKALAHVRPKPDVVITIAY